MNFSRECKFPVIALIFLLFLVPVDAVHGQPHHVRRSLAFRKGVHRQLDVAGLLTASLPAILGDGSQSSSDPGGTSTGNSSPSSPQTSSVNPSTTDAPSTSEPPQTTVPSSSTPDSSPSSPPSSSDSATSSNSPAVTSPQPTSPTSSPSPSPSPSPSASPSPSVSCPLGLDLAGNCVLPAVSSTPANSPSDTPTSNTTPPQTNPASTSTPETSPTSVPQAQSSQPPVSTDTPASSPVVCLSPSILINGVCVLSPSSSTPSAPAGSSPGPSSSQQPSASSSQPPPSSSTPTPSSVVCLPPSVSINGVCIAPRPSIPASSTNVQPSVTQPATASQPVLTSPSETDLLSSSAPAPSSSSPIDPCGPLGRSLGLCPTSPSSTPNQANSLSPSQPPPSSSGFVDSSSRPSLTLPLPTSFTPVESCGPEGVAQGLCSSTPPAVTVPGSSISGAPSESVSSLSFPLTASPSLQADTSLGSLSASSSPPVISFPSGSSDSLSQTASLPSTVSSGPSSPAFTPPPNSQFSYVTMTSLLGVFVPSPSIPITQTNPDAPLTTLSLVTPSDSTSGPASAAPLPSNLPARILPANPVDPQSVSSGYTFCSLLFTATLRWDYVALVSQVQGQLFAWTPNAIGQALGIDPSLAPPFALQVFVPNTYQGPGDVDQLLTAYLFYLPTDQVPVLANQLKVKSSPFYNVDFPYRQVSEQVDASFALTSVSNPDAIPGSPSAATSGGDKSRTNTIIGVVSGLGGLALIILGVLIFNGVKRSRELRHRRLSDPNVPNDPYPDRAGRDFDQDSIGGQRRRSFYFAEDSLRGQQTVEQSPVSLVPASTQYVAPPGAQIQYSQRTSPESMRERRAPVVPASISAPVLTQSSLNW